MDWQKVVTCYILSIKKLENSLRIELQINVFDHKSKITIYNLHFFVLFYMNLKCAIVKGIPFAHFETADSVRLWSRGLTQV